MRNTINCYTLGLLVGLWTCMTGAIDQYIIGGSEAPITRADNHVVLIESRQNGDPLCHGAFVKDPRGIPSQSVLTTASCTQGLTAEDITVVLGLYDRSNDAVAQPERYTVMSIYRYPYWAESSGYPNDLAVLTLLDFPNTPGNVFIDDILVPTSAFDYKNFECWMLGWGTTTNPEEGWESILHYANMTIMEHEDCVDAWENMADITSGHLCARGKLTDVSACTGESGASLHCLTENGRLELAGIASWVRTGCDPSFPTVFTQVPWYGEWINCLIVNRGTEEGAVDCVPLRNCPCDSLACPPDDCMPYI